MPDMTLVHKMAHWAHQFDMSKIQPSAVELMKNSVLDALGVAILTLDEECSKGVMDYVRQSGGRPDATLIGGGKAPLSLATLANGTLIRAIDLNDHLAMDPNDGVKLGGHPSDNIAAIIAAGEVQNHSGRTVMESLLAAYELYGRLFKFVFFAPPWDHTSAFSMSIPAVAGRMMGLDEARTAHAIAISATQSISLGVARRGQLSHSKFLASSLIEEHAMEAVALAALGVTGPMTIFEDPRGFAAAEFAPHPRLQDLVGPLGPLHMIEGVTIKAFPGMDTTQAATQAILEATGRRKLRASDITKIEITMNDHPMTRDQTIDPDRRRPNSRETADHSYYYLIAVALLDGEMTNRQFEPGRWFEPDVCDLMARMTITNDPVWTARAPGGCPCSVRIATRDGLDAFVEVPYAIGHPRNKMSREGIVEKFRANTERRLPNKRSDEIIAAVSQLDHLGSIRELTELFVQ